MTRDQIKAIALASGFTERQQADGSMDLNGYVYAFAEEMYAEGRKVEREACALICEKLSLNHVEAEMSGLEDGSWEGTEHYGQDEDSQDWKKTAENHAKATAWMMLQCAAEIRKRGAA